MSFEDDFLQGQRDCIAGVAHESGKDEAYDRGYATEYEKQQIATELALHNEPQRSQQRGK